MALAAVCAVSMLIVPNDVSAQDGCGSRSNGCCAPAEEECCASGGWGSSFLVLGGAAAAGAIAGYFAGQSNGHRGKKGRKGLQGDPGTNCVVPVRPSSSSSSSSSDSSLAGISGDFVRDGTVLTFSFPLTDTVEVGLNAGTVTYTPFVSLPDGTVVEGTPVSFTGPTATVDLTFPPIMVPAMTGTYTVGVQVSSRGTVRGLDIVGMGLAINVFAPRDGSNTTFMLGAVDFLLPIITGSKAQASVDFTYGAPPVP